MPYKNKEDQAKSAKKHYLKNKKKIVTRAMDYKTNVSRPRIKEYIKNYLSTHHCVDCGESDPIVLEFDHLRDKKMNIADSASKGYSLKIIQEEIDKCEVRCANCHRRKTHERKLNCAVE